MTTRMNDFDQPVGDALPDWSGARLPDAPSLEGRYCRLERLSAEPHGAGLYAAYRDAADARDWTYLPSGPYDTPEAYHAWLLNAEKQPDPRHYAVIDLATGQPVGTVALMRIDAANGVIEVGYVTYSPRMQRTRLATEVMALFLRYVFDELGYRRFEWKCDALNAPSCAAAARFGFTFEGIFRQAIVTRGRNRDTAWYSIIDSEYPALRAAFEQWLAPSNFDANGVQQHKLAQLIAESRSVCVKASS